MPRRREARLRHCSKVVSSKDRVATIGIHFENQTRGGLDLVSSLDRATHIAGDALDLMFVSCEVVLDNITVPRLVLWVKTDVLSSSWVGPLPLRPLRAVTAPAWTCAYQTGRQHLFPIVKDWSALHVAAQESLQVWSCVKQLALESEPGCSASHSLQMHNLYSHL